MWVKRVIEVVESIFCMQDSGSASGGSVDDPDVSPPTTQDVGPQTTCSDTVLSRKVVLKGTSA